MTRTPQPMTRIYFGKHSGKTIQELPSHYLVFLIEECNLSDSSLVQAARDELSHRLKIDLSSSESDDREAYIAQIEADNKALAEQAIRDQRFELYLLDLIKLHGIKLIHPHILKPLIKAAEIEKANRLPDAFVGFTSLPPSQFNLYRLARKQQHPTNH